MKREELGEEIARVTMIRYENGSEIDVASTAQLVIELTADLLIRLSSIMKTPMQGIYKKLVFAVAQSEFDMLRTKTE